MKYPNQIVQIHPSWYEQLKEEFDKAYFKELRATLKDKKRNKINFFPPSDLIFNAFDKTPFEKVRVVILGQDPYHNPGQAMGLSFSVPRTKKRPPSLLNIYKELSADLGCDIASHGDLSEWADQGVLLLNAILTVEENKPGSHRSIGWQQFTDQVITTLSERQRRLVFMLWGNFAKSKKDMIDESKHLVLTSAHPSPLAGKAFFNNHHFSKANEFLVKNKLNPINWQLTI